jgi:hypothetical protein
MQQNVSYIWFLIKVFNILEDVALTNESKDNSEKSIPFPLWKLFF